MAHLKSLSLRDQHAVLAQFVGAGPKQPFVSAPAPILQVMRRPSAPDPASASAEVTAMQPVDTFVIDLRADPGIRFIPQGHEPKPEKRHLRPWIQAHPVGTDKDGPVIARLTTEGRRRLFALTDLLLTDDHGCRRLS